MQSSPGPVCDPAGQSALTLRQPQRLTTANPIAPPQARAPSFPARLRSAVASAAGSEADHGLAFLFLPVAMGAGAGFYYMAARDPGFLLPGLGFVIAALVAIFARENHIGLARIAGFAAALCAGSLAASIEQQRGAVLLDQDVTTQISGVVEAREFDAGGKVRYLIRLVSTSDPEIRRPPGRVRLTARSQHQPVPIGADISGRARLSAPSGPVMPGGYDFAFRAFIDGIGAHGFFYRAPEGGDAPIQAQKGLWQTFKLGLRNVRESISARIRSVLPGDPGGIAAALAVSDRRGISPETVDALRATGLAHILAISGLHMALAAGTLYIGIRKALAIFPALVEGWPIKKFAAIGALMAATAYLMISGGSVATQRAWVMLAIMLIAVLADRPALTMRNVALAAMVIILITPSAVVGPGFQMSFAATAALISAYGALAARTRNREGSPRGILSRWAPTRLLVLFAKAALGLALTSLVAGLATGLFSAHHFHRVAGNGVLANLMAMPLVTFVVMPSGLFALLLMPFGLDALPLQLMGKGLEGVIASANYVQALGGDLVTGQISLLATITAGAGFVILVFLRSWLRLGGIALIGLGAILAMPPLRPATPDILINEDGTLVALATHDGLASNAARPSEFVFDQWQAALRGLPHLAPMSVKPATTDSSSEPAILDQLLVSAAQQPGRFHCASRGLCAALQHDARIIAINDAALMGAACDRADLVVVSIPVYMRSCRSGATLVTARSLRRTGSLAISIAKRGSAAAQSSNNSSGQDVRPDFQINAALGGVIRPWTIQRYFDWRSNSYDVPD